VITKLILISGLVFKKIMLRKQNRNRMISLILVLTLLHNSNKIVKLLALILITLKAKLMIIHKQNSIKTKNLLISILLNKSHSKK